MGERKSEQPPTYPQLSPSPVQSAVEFANEEPDSTATNGRARADCPPSQFLVCEESAIIVDRQVHSTFPLPLHLSVPAN